MKKHLIAAAVAAAVAVPAMAQSNVELYGIVDLGYSNQSTTTFGNVETKTSGLNRGVAGLSTSRLGVRGTEDLGGGLKASFVVETALDSESSSTVWGSSRLANVALQGNFGTARLGRQVSIGKAMNDTYTAFGGGGTLFQGSVGIEATSATILGTTTGQAFKDSNIAGRLSNALTYTTPTMGGFSATAMLGDTKTDASNLEGQTSTKAWGLMGSYTAGAISAALAYSKTDSDTQAVTSPSTPAKNGVENELTQAGLKFNYGPGNIFALYNKGSYKASDSSADLDIDAIDVGITYNIGAVTLLASYGTGEIEDSATVKRDVDGYQFQAHYALSKRTTAYGIYGKTTADKQTGDTAEAKSDVFMIGVRHSF